MRRQNKRTNRRRRRRRNRRRRRKRRRGGEEEIVEPVEEEEREETESDEKEVGEEKYNCISRRRSVEVKRKRLTDDGRIILKITVRLGFSEFILGAVLPRLFNRKGKFTRLVIKPRSTVWKTLCHLLLQS